MYDFYLPELNMYVELTAYIDPEVISLKKAYTTENNITINIRNLIDSKIIYSNKQVSLDLSNCDDITDITILF
jgi:hypothetical protein